MPGFDTCHLLSLHITDHVQFLLNSLYKKSFIFNVHIAFTLHHSFLYLIHSKVESFKADKILNEMENREDGGRDGERTTENKR